MKFMKVNRLALDSQPIFCLLMSQYTRLFVILVISRFGFEGWIWVLTASVPDLCILFMPPTLKKLMGHIAFGACVGACVGG